MAPQLGKFRARHIRNKHHLTETGPLAAHFHRSLQGHSPQRGCRACWRDPSKTSWTRLWKWNVATSQAPKPMGGDATFLRRGIAQRTHGCRPTPTSRECGAQQHCHDTRVSVASIRFKTPACRRPCRNTTECSRGPIGGQPQPTRPSLSVTLVACRMVSLRQWLQD